MCTICASGNLDKALMWAMLLGLGNVKRLNRQTGQK